LLASFDEERNVIINHYGRFQNTAWAHAPLREQRVTPRTQPVTLIPAPLS
jgi:hypothetical protein